jgi:lipoprotein-releasing system permease protein
MRTLYLLHELARRPARTLTALLSVAVGVALFLSLQAYAEGYRAGARAPLAEMGADLVVQREGPIPESFAGVVLPHSTAPLSKAEIDALAALPDVEAAGVALFFWAFDSDRFTAALGLAPGQATGLARLQAGLRAGRFLEPQDRDVVVADVNYATQMGLKVGDSVELAGRTFSVVGLADTSRVGHVARANLYMTLSDARAMVAAAPNVKAVHTVGAEDANLVFLQTDPLLTGKVAEAAAQLLGERTMVTTPQAFEATLGTAFALVDRFGMLVGLAGLLVALAGLVRAAAAGLWERRRDFGLMRAVGWRRRDIVAHAVAETLTVTAMGCLAGFGLAHLVAAGLRTTQVTVPIPWELSPTPHFLPGGAEAISMTVPFGARITASAALAATGMALGCAAGVSFWLARRTASIKPAEVWRNE